MFDSLTGRLDAALKKLTGRGKLSEADVDAGLRDIRLALLEADVNYKVARDFIARIRERAVGAEVMESLTPGQQHFPRVIVAAAFHPLPRIGRRPGPLRFGGGKSNKLASRRKRVTTQTWLRTAARNSIAANAVSATITMVRSGSQRWICRTAWRAQSSRVFGARALPP